METEASRAAKEVDRLVDEYRRQCLWFLRPDYYPCTREERLRVLGYIERYGDLARERDAREGGLPSKAWVKIGRIRTLAIERLGPRITRASAEETEAVLEGLNEILGG